jgi:hypothetical protein
MRTTLLLLVLALCQVGYAQQSNITEARKLLASNNYEKAKPLVNWAVINDETKNNAEAWFLRGLAYLMQATDNSSGVSGESQEAYVSFMKALELKPDYNAEINFPLYGIAIIKFNTGVAAYSAGKYYEAYKEFMVTDEIYRLGKTTRFADIKDFPGLSIEARKNAAYAAINAGHDNSARPILEGLIKEDAKSDMGIYQSLIEIYEAGRNEKQQLETIRAARLQFPEQEVFKKMEADYYAKADKSVKDTKK